ncbi:MAG: hypothetical protein ABI718_12880 [Acidobacteriota bacterium]
MKRIPLVLLVVLFALPVFAVEDPCAPEVSALQAFYDIRNLMIQPYSSSYDLQERVDYHLDRLREPAGDGTYRWVRWTRPSGSAPDQKKEHTVTADQGAGENDTFDASSTHPFAVSVVVPRKRSLLKANNRVYVSRLVVHYWVDGREKVMEKVINDWLRPDTSRSFDLGDIADRADASAVVSAAASDLKEALVEIHFKQAVAQDDPENPNYDTIKRLKQFASYPTPASVDDEIARLESRLFGRPSSLPIATFIARIREAEKLKKSKKEEEQKKGQTMLEDALSMVKD